MVDIKSLKDPVGLLNDLYARLLGIRGELEKRIEEADFYYPTQEDMLNRRELDAIRTLIRYIEEYDNQ